MKPRGTRSKDELACTSRGTRHRRAKAGRARARAEDRKLCSHVESQTGGLYTPRWERTGRSGKRRRQRRKAERARLKLPPIPPVPAALMWTARRP